MKQKFAKALIEALSDQSAQKLYPLCNNFHDMKNVGMDSDLTEQRLGEIVLANCVKFIETVDFNIDDFDLESINIEQTADAVVLEEGYSVVFADSIKLLFNGLESSENLRIKVDCPIIINNDIKINNPLMIECCVYEPYIPVPPPESIMVVDTHGQTHELLLTDSNIIESRLKNKDRDVEFYSGHENWYIHEGDLELDSLSLEKNVLISGNLLLHELMVEPTEGLIVLGKTVLNALCLDDANDVFLLGGIDFNVAVISIMAGQTRVLRDLDGPLVYNSSDSTSIEGTSNVGCYVDYVYGDSHGVFSAILNSKYLELDEDEVHVDGELIAYDIPLGEQIFTSEDITKKHIAVNWPDFDDVDMIKALLKADGLYFKKLDEQYKSDKSFIDIAIEQNAKAFKYIPKELKNDEAYVHELVGKDGGVFEFLAKKFRKDKALALLAMQTDSYAFSMAHRSLRADKELALIAIEHNASLLEYVSGDLQADEDVLMEVINKKPDAFKYASPSAISNEKLMLALVKKSPKYLAAPPLKGYRNNKIFALQVLEENPSAFNYLSKQLQKDREVRDAAGQVV